jgi:hypothetical protein
MPESSLHPWTYRVLRYTPNLVRDEWVNIGILLYDGERKRLQARLIEEDSEMVRIRRLHPAADENLLRALPADFEAQIAASAGDPAGFLARLDQTLSNVLMLSPQKALLGEDFGAELERLYQEQVAPPRYPGRAGRWLEHTRAAIRARVADALRRVGIWSRVQKAVRVEKFTFPGDPLRMDYSYHRNGTTGFAQTLSLERDPSHAKVLAYTTGCIRAKLASSEFAAITEAEPRAENPRDRFVRDLLEDQRIEIVPLVRLDAWANRLRASLRD